MSKRYAGIAWTAAGYRVEVLDDAGRRVAEPSSWSGDRVAELIGWLEGFGDGEVPAVVLDSTNGLLDGPMTAAGLEVYRADPWLLPPRPDFGSVTAVQLAEQARTAPGALARVTAEGGTLTGRADEYFEGVERGEPARAALTAAGRCFDHGRRDDPRVALTFDDGPDPVFTRQVVEILGGTGPARRSSVSATMSRRCPTRYARSPRPGHEVGNHSWSHPFLPDLTPEQLREQLDRTGEELARVTGAAPGVVPAAVRGPDPRGAGHPRRLPDHPDHVGRRRPRLVEAGARADRRDRPGGRRAGARWC
ncbi:Polysaccharide deacetylase family protein OS=Streptomyces cyaneofuscatus OX=66883 GN=G3I52_18725 PE=4 SV=1 [Streptomyces cyaneofuscatus]